MLEVIDNEDTVIGGASGKLGEGQTLAQMWHELKEVTPKSYVQALRMVTRGKKGEVTIVRLPAGETIVRQLDQAVRSCDLEQQFYEDKKENRA